MRQVVSTSVPASRPGACIAGFMQRRGRRIVDACGCLWHSVEGRFLMSLPYQTPQEPDDAELRRLLRQERLIGARFPSHRRPGLASGVYMFRGRSYDVGAIHQKQRAQVRRGLERFEVRPVSEAELAVQGAVLNRETMLRQGRFDTEFGVAKLWTRLVRAVFDSPGVVAYGAFRGQSLGAYVITCRDAGCLHILHQMSRTASLPDCPNHALTYAVTRMCAEDPSLDTACYGVVGLVGGDGLNTYKTRFGYEVVAQTDSFLFHPAVAPALSSVPVRLALALLRRLRPRDQRLEKACNVLDGARLTSGLAPAEGDLRHVANRLG